MTCKDYKTLNNHNIYFIFVFSAIFGILFRYFDKKFMTKIYYYKLKTIKWKKLKNLTISAQLSHQDL